jgi:hypothetical protein
MGGVRQGGARSNRHYMADQMKQEQQHGYKGDVQLPNELRIKRRGNLMTYVGEIMDLMLGYGYKNCKLVGRGGAYDLTLNVMHHLQKHAP